MFELGTSLRDARERKQLTFADLEQVTKVRAKYLRALEDDEFAMLPGPTYVKGFLRSYAEALGLDGQLYVDEYTSRFLEGEEETTIRPLRPSVPPRRSGWIERNAVVLALAAIAVVTAVVIGAWRFVPDKTPSPRTPAKAGPAVVTRPQARLVLHARGNTWLEVHAGSPTGRLLFQGTLERGQSKRFASPRLWLNVGAPVKLSATLNGRAVKLPSRKTSLVLVATPSGVVPVAAG